MQTKGFIKIDNNNNIIDSYYGPFDEKNSNQFLKDGYIEVLDDSIILLDTINPLKYINNKIVINTEQKKINDEQNQLQELLLTLHSNLQNTDYIACKIAEGAITTEECKDILNLRAEWRKTINEIQNALNN